MVNTTLSFNLIVLRCTFYALLWSCRLNACELNEDLYYYQQNWSNYMHYDNDGHFVQYLRMILRRQYNPQSLSRTRYQFLFPLCAQEFFIPLEDEMHRNCPELR